MSNLEEWLWGHLVALRVDPALPAAIYADLQKQIAVDLGEWARARSAGFGRVGGGGPPEASRLC